MRLENSSRGPEKSNSPLPPVTWGRRGAEGASEGARVALALAPPAGRGRVPSSRVSALLRPVRTTLPDRPRLLSNHCTQRERPRARALLLRSCCVVPEGMSVGAVHHVPRVPSKLDEYGHLKLYNVIRRVIWKGNLVSVSVMLRVGSSHLSFFPPLGGWDAKRQLSTKGWQICSP